MSVPSNLWLRILEKAESDPAGESPFGRYLRQSYDFPARSRYVLQRYRKLTERYLERFGDGELSIARAPGRINLIGEHTDYNGLPVFPMAMDRDIAAVFCPRRDRRVVIANTDPGFDERSFEIQGEISPYPTGDWGNYCKAAVQGILDYYRDRHREPGRFRGFQAVLDGDIPMAAGLSSSSALVVLCALIFLAANNLDLHRAPEKRIELADLLASAERYVGTQGGGMDQAISLLGRPGQAVRIDFFPLRTRPAPLPEGCSLVVADSTVQAAKTAEALDKYNRRPIECRLAAAVLKKAFSDRCGREVPISLLGDLKEEKLAIAEADIWKTAEAALHEQAYGLEEIAGILGQSPEKTAYLYCRRRDGSIFPEPPDGFQLRRRYRHVVEEARRVDRSVKALEAGDVFRFGELMNQSHESCRDLYEISSQELDSLVQISRQAGALGSRLTGAGFGGCTVSLVANNRLESYLRQVIQSYYRDYLNRENPASGRLIFPCRAAGGAGLFGEFQQGGWHYEES